MDKFESMRAFTQVVEQGGFAAAARKMQLSRSAVNKLVINLENNLGVQLLYRTTRQVILTDNGRAFYDRCLNILSSLEEAELAVTRQHQEPKGNLKINAPMSFGISFLGAQIAEFMARYTEINIQLTLEDRFIDPISEGYDLVIRLSDPLESPSLIVHSITNISRVICAAPSYLQARGIPDNLSDLTQHSCLHYGYLATGDRWPIVDREQEELVAINGVFCCNNGEILKEAAVNGLGIVLLPYFLVEQELKQGKLQAILPDYPARELTLSVIYPVNRHLSTKVQLFTQFLRDRFNGT
ncbi:LysR family transcriptional regulator [Roseofilum casamattae]|uniref:LysR family transcriptional regulator n=1 Tax=Roseofilum casamattae BLCC-M143 TaxID=3022442 RepID=A0ABT7BVK6_9CYAN|nr:LysR family transcriptional regulator [Roseofilum casamattae]MDJ1183227.1 LysR family transcriptional regulator [Roseofilum casamattae BLCC-M143]